MIRATLFFVVVLGLVVSALLWVNRQSGQVSIQWSHWIIEMEVAHFALGILILVVLALIVLGLVRMVFRAPGQIRDGLRGSRRKRGYRALTQGMVAVAAGDPDEALRFARRAATHLDEPPLTMLLSAQAAQLQGDEEAAQNYFVEMLEQRETAFLGLRGLAMQAQRNGDRYAAYEYATQAQELRPGANWVLGTLLDFKAWKCDWSGALQVLEEADRHGGLEEISREGRCAVLLGCSIEAEEAGDMVDAQRFANRAQSLAPEYLPAVLRNVDLLMRSGKKRPAIRKIQEAWKRTPHPELARIYSGEGAETEPLSRVRQLEQLLSFNSEHDESHIALAEASLGAHLWGEARNHLEQAASQGLSSRVCRLMAELEEHEHNDGDKARSWLLKASQAAPDPAWVCKSCAAVWENWTPTCGGCGSLGTLDWLPPARAQAPQISADDKEVDHSGDLVLTEEVPGELSMAGLESPKPIWLRFRERR